jgi:hypothetical protein
MEKRQHCISVTEMQYLTIPVFPTLRGEEAIKALNEYIKELEGQKPVELTEKQVNALIKFARELISTIELETPKTLKENIKQTRCASFKKLKDKVLLRVLSK